jgi:tetratricopeptide (TPR) repeat protein
VHDPSVDPEKPASDYLAELANASSTNRLTEAKQVLEEALALYPDHLDVLLAANSLYRACLDYDSAIAFAKTIIHHHPLFFDGYCRAAQDLSFCFGRYEEAIDIISTGLERNPEEMWTLWTAFLIYSDVQQDDRALELGHRLAQLHPTFGQIYPLLTALLLKNGQKLKAE